MKVMAMIAFSGTNTGGAYIIIINIDITISTTPMITTPASIPQQPQHFLLHKHMGNSFSQFDI